MSLQNLPGEGNQGEPLRQEAQGAPAAPEYPIRALVRADALHYPVNGLCRGEVIAVRPNRPSDGPGLNGYFAWGALEKADLFFVPAELILDPTPEQIAEERAKAGLPADGGEAAPEASEGSTSLPAPTVPKGGDVDLVEALRKYGCHVHAPGPMCERAKHSEYPCTCGLDEILAKLESR